jgi:hypothetical protein
MKPVIDEVASLVEDTWNLKPKTKNGRSGRPL